jgi:DNA invertase Pin-like site-specific DNA recombinase
LENGAEARIGDRPELAKVTKVIGRLEPGDVLVVSHLDRLLRDAAIAASRVGS